MPKFFIASRDGKSYLTVRASDADDALEAAKGTVSKEIFQQNLKNETPLAFEITTRDVSGVATRDFPEEADPIVLEIEA